MGKKDHKPHIIVGIGASAGGLAVLKDFVQSLPQESNLAYVVVQHLDPTHESMLADLLSKVSKVTVMDAADGQEVKPDHVYVLPPNYYIELEGRTIKLTEPEQSHGSRKAIDHFFRSLAKECGDRCAGVIVSGAGADGTAGLRAIKAAGGLSLVQKPEMAKHPSMPESAIKANVVDKVCDVKAMYEVLSRFAEHPMTKKNLGEKKKPNETESAEESLNEIAAILKTHEDFNLKQYKPSTVQRRIARRMSLTNTAKYKNYLQLLRDSKQERQFLTKDLLINVTDFFRDPKAFEILEQQVIPDILDKVERDEDIRIWVAGCASGEEAYSLAILLLEALDEARMKNDIKIFATDIDEHAIKIARKGKYPDSIAAEVPKKYLDKYFVKVENDHHFCIKNQVRDLISFAVQNVATDPPFNHMHLISCRNLLIYLNRDVQEKVLASFYFSLEDNNYLFLGSSESLGNKAELFKTTSKKWRLYQKIPGRNKNKVMLEHLHVNLGTDKILDKKGRNQTKSIKREKALSRSEQIRQSILDVVVPPTVVVDQDGNVLYNHGKLDSFFEWPKGEPRYNIIQLVKPAIRSRLRSALYKAKKTLAPIKFHCALPGDHDPKQLVIIDIIHIPEQQYVDGHAFGIVFTKDEALNDIQKEALTKDDENKANYDLEQELAETKEELQNTIEELETSSEELKAAHEEALSTNEELQSSNEELEASSEELRSLNEELSTVNAQLKEKIQELKKANDDVENFFTSTDIPTIFLDPDLKIQRYTPAAEQLLKMGPRDLDREIFTLGRDLVDNDLTEECKDVLRNFQPKSKEIQDYQGRWFIRHVSPYRTEDRRIEGLVLVFQEVTELKKLSQRAEGREKQQAVVAQLGILALGGTEPEELMHQAVRQVAHVLEADYCKILKYQPEDHHFLLFAGVGWQEGLVGKATVSDDQNSQAGFTLLSKTPIIVKNLKEEKRFNGPSLLIDHHVTSGISCLINHTEPPFGVLGVHTKEERIFSEDDANFLQSVANMLSTALRTRQAQAQIFESEAKFRSMANSIPQLAWMTDETGYIFWYNQRWYDYTGTTLNETEGWKWQKLHHPEHVERVVKNFMLSLETGKKWEDTFPLRSKDGKYRWFLSRANPIHDQKGKTIQWFGTNTDITEKLEQEEALRQSEERLRLAKDSASLGLFEYDIVHNTIEWEPLLRSIWGINSDDYVSIETFFAGLHPDDVDHTQKAIDNATNPEGDGHYEVTYRVINKLTEKIYWIKANGIVLFEEGKPVRMIGLVNDISEEKKLELSLQQAKEIAESAAQAKEDFLSTMSHEIRTPLNAILGIGDLLIEKDPKPEQLENLNTLKFSSESLMSLINDILDYSKLEAGKISLERVHYDLETILNSIKSSHQLAADTRNNKLQVELAQDIPKILVGDQMKLAQVLNNLISNAVKFTQDGSVLLKVLLNRLEDNVAHLSFFVEDNGVGIAEEKVEKIFEKFEQADSSIVREYGGTGLGLAITKNLLLLMGSEIQVESIEGKGSVFSFTLKQEVGKEEKAVNIDRSSSEGVVKQNNINIKILLVEDVHINRMVAQQYFMSWWNIEADEAFNGKEAVEKAKQQKYDVILMDVRMPVMGGKEATNEIKSNGGLNTDTPIIAITADTSSVNFEANFVEVITKPFVPKVLYQKIIKHAQIEGKVNLEIADLEKQQEREGKRKLMEPNFSKTEETFEGLENKKVQFYQIALKSLEEYTINYTEGLRGFDKKLISDAMHKVKPLFDMLGLEQFYKKMYATRTKMEEGEDYELIEKQAKEIASELEVLKNYIHARIELLSS